MWKGWRVGRDMKEMDIFFAWLNFGNFVVACDACISFGYTFICLYMWGIFLFEVNSNMIKHELCLHISRKHVLYIQCICLTYKYIMCCRVWNGFTKVMFFLGTRRSEMVRSKLVVYIFIFLHHLSCWPFLWSQGGGLTMVCWTYGNPPANSILDPPIWGLN